MKAFKGLWVALLFAPQLLGQTSPSSSIQHPNKEEFGELSHETNSIRDYCQTVANYSMSYEPRLFAKTRETGTWDEFPSKAEWERAGKPKPAAFAWYKEKQLVRAVFSLKNDSDGSARHADYCYRGDGRLAHLRSEAETSAVCDDAHYHCQLTLAREWFYLPKERVISVIFDDQRLLKSEKTSISLSRKPTQYLTIWELPFGNSLLALSK
jgi:hypothetical protein